MRACVGVYKCLCVCNVPGVCDGERDSLSEKDLFPLYVGHNWKQSAKTVNHDRIKKITSLRQLARKVPNQTLGY